jgi:hypothetical protein
MLGGKETTDLKGKSHRSRKRKQPKSVLHPDLEHARNAVLNSLRSPDAQRGYRDAIEGSGSVSEQPTIRELSDFALHKGVYRERS